MSDDIVIMEIKFYLVIKWWLNASYAWGTDLETKEKRQIWHSHYLQNLSSTQKSKGDTEMACRSLHNTSHNASLSDKVLAYIYFGSESWLYF